MMISVVVPVHKGNLGELRDCLDSLFRNDNIFETILVFNGIEKGFLEPFYRYKDVKIIHSQEKMTPAKARNIGAEKSKMMYIAFLDSDCIVKTDYIKTIIKAFKENPEVHALAGEVKAKHIRSLWMFFEEIEHQKAFGKYVYAKNGKRYAKILKGANCVIKKNIFNKIGGFDENYASAEDRELGAKLFSRGYRILFLPVLKVEHAYHSSMLKIIKRHLWHAYGNSMNYCKYPEVFEHPFAKTVNYILDGFIKCIKREMPISFLFYKICIGLPYLLLFNLLYIRNKLWRMELIN